jgi:hypothetical protein
MHQTSFLDEIIITFAILFVKKRKLCLHFSNEYVNILLIYKSNDWVVWCYKRCFSESGMVGAACAQHWAFPHEP